MEWGVVSLLKAINFFEWCKVFNFSFYVGGGISKNVF